MTKLPLNEPIQSALINIFGIVPQFQNPDCKII